jgi:hypothetical protein
VHAVEGRAEARRRPKPARFLHPPVERLVRFSLKPLTDSVHRQHYDTT